MAVCQKPQPKTSYPRIPHTSIIVREEDWCQDSPFGHCPACEELGIEHLRIRGDPEMFFYCSDPMCRTILKGGLFVSRTKWSTKKPKEILKMEEKFNLVWNKDKWPSEYRMIPIFCAL